MDKVMKLVGGWYIINGATLSSLIQLCILFLDKYTYTATLPCCWRDLFHSLSLAAGDNFLQRLPTAGYNCPTVFLPRI